MGIPLAQPLCHPLLLVCYEQRQWVFCSCRYCCLLCLIECQQSSGHHLMAPKHQNVKNWLQSIKLFVQLNPHKYHKMKLDWYCILFLWIEYVYFIVFNVWKIPTSVLRRCNDLDSIGSFFECFFANSEYWRHSTNIYYFFI